MMGFWGNLPAADRAAARRLLASLSASALVKKPWQILSQGERQRVLIARALMARPKLLLLDEPCSGLDPVARERFLAFLHALGERKTTAPMVLVTHHVEEILPVFTHALILREGRTLASGPIQSVVTERTLRVAFDGPVRLIRKSGRFQMRINA